MSSGSAENGSGFEMRGVQSMKDKLSKNILPGIVFLVFGIVMYCLTPGQIQTDETSAFTARTFPCLILGIIMLCSVLLILQGVAGILKERKEQREEAAAESKGNPVLFLEVLALMAAAALLGRVTSLLVSGILIGTGFLVLYRDKKPLHYVIEIAVIAAAYFLFKSVFGLDLP